MRGIRAKLCGNAASWRFHFRKGFMGDIFRLDIFTFSYVGFFVAMVCFATAVHILLNKHEEPVSAVLWLVLVFSFPGLGVALYIVFGVNRVRTRGLRIQTSTDRMLSGLESGGESRQVESSVRAALANRVKERHEFEFKGGEGGYPEHDRFLDRALPDTIPLSGNKIDLLLDGTEAYPSMLDAIERAESSVHLQSYIITNDEIGRKLLGALRLKADSGVEVRILYDKFGSFPAMASRLFAAFMRGTTNLRARAFAQAVPWGIQLRNHRKLLVVDGREGFVGGINISSENDGRSAGKDKYIHDLHCRVEGPVVGELQFVFLRDWHHVSKSSAKDLLSAKYFPFLKAAGDSVARVVASGPGQSYEASEQIHMAAATTARRSVWITAPYFVPDKPFLKALAAAATRGLDVRVIVPRRNNHWYVQLATRSLYPFLIGSGVRVFERSGPFSHAKATLVDGEWARMGSSNCDVRSFRLNYELDLVVERGDFIKRLHDQFEMEFAASSEIAWGDLAGKSAGAKLAENFCALFTPIL